MLDRGVRPPDLLRQVRLYLVHRDGGPLLKDGAAQRRGERQADAQQRHLDGALQARAAPEEAAALKVVDDDRDQYLEGEKGAGGGGTVCLCS